MNINLYTNLSSKEHIFKNLNNEISLTGTLRQGTSVMNPILTITNQPVVNKNYCYIPDFNRYYFINDIISVNNNAWEIHCSVDVLMSFATDILNLDVIINKQEVSDNDVYINDNTNVINTKRFNTIVNFPNNFEDKAQYVLVMAGGE